MDETINYKFKKVTYNNGDRYEGYCKDEKQKEKEYIIGIMVIDMKEIIKMIKEKEK